MLRKTEVDGRAPTRFHGLVHTLAMFIEPGIEAGGRGSDGVLVGRRVANEAFLRALVRHADVARFLWFIGEESQRASVVSFVERLAHFDPQRIQLAHRLELPDHLAAGEISVLHHESHWGWFFDLVALRDRFSDRHVPVTGQIHSLSYPRMLESYLRGSLAPPGPGDAIFCSSESGRLALDESLRSVQEAAAASGLGLPEMNFLRAVVPLGIDLEELDESARTHPRAELRSRLNISNEAIVLLVLGRFSEYDKMDLFPLLRVFGWLREACADLDLQLVLAGARQGTGTADMLEVWARALGLSDRVHLVVDFPASEKGGWLAAADVFVSPSDNVQETFGLSVIEAMAMGLPVVVSDFDGYRDTVPDDAGWRVPTHAEADLSLLRLYGQSLFERPLHLLLGQGVSVSPRALLSTLRLVCEDPEARSARGARARAFSRSAFAWEAVVPRYEAVWKRLRLMPKRAVAPRDPFGMDFSRVFAGHFAGVRDDETPLVVLGDPSALRIYLHPELRSLFQQPDVHYALSLLQSTPLGAAALRNELERERLGSGLRGQLGAEALVAWLLKQGLVARQTPDASRG